MDFLAAGLSADRQRKEAEQALVLRSQRPRPMPARRLPNAPRNGNARRPSAPRSGNVRRPVRRGAGSQSAQLIMALGAGLAVASILVVFAFGQYRTARTEAKQRQDRRGAGEGRSLARQRPPDRRPGGPAARRPVRPRVSCSASRRTAPKSPTRRSARSSRPRDQTPD